MNFTQYLPAAQYLRMSTEHQQYSMENQAAAIREYADRFGFSVLSTYADPGKSGLVLRRRLGLRSLLTDVMSGMASFKAILVYDVSRWGRFQDSDESAHYEFLCKQAGIPVHYCAESFLNDQSIPSIIMKSLKRTMAAEYSRELSRRVFEGHKRLAQLGFKQGGAAGYGLRRMLVSAERICKQELKSGEYKSIATDRVVLVPGPAEEIATVHEIYRMFIKERRSVRGIVDELNRRKIAWEGSKPWKYATVHRILHHPKYTGCHVYGARTTKLSTPVRFLPKSQWLMKAGAFEPVVDSATFAAAQKIRENRTIKLSNEDLLKRLRRLLKSRGRLTSAIIGDSATMPSVSTYRVRFGGLEEAYEQIGYATPGQFAATEGCRRRTRVVRNQLIEEIKATFPSGVDAIQNDRRNRVLVQIEGVNISIRTARFVKLLNSGSKKWLTTAVPEEADLITLVALLTPDDDRIESMFMFRRLKKNRIVLAFNDDALRQGIKLHRIADLLKVVRRFTRHR